MKPNRLKQLSEKEFLERLEKSRKQSKEESNLKMEKEKMQILQ